MSNCIEGALDPYAHSNQNPWDATKVRHLYNRIACGASLEQVELGLLKSPSDLVDELIQEAIDLPNLDDVFPWGYKPFPLPAADEYPSRYYRFFEVIFHFIGGMARTPVRHKLTLFWHSHFATESEMDGPIATFIFLYYRQLHEFAFGNFKESVEKMGLNPQMLGYLNGRNNVAGKANENYARELLELFTMGDGNYNQSDIENIARGLTGWDTGRSELDFNNGNFVVYPDDTVFKAGKHDTDSITLFERLSPDFNNSDPKEAALEKYNWIHDVIFEERAVEISKFICKKLYKYYVYHEVDDEIIDGLATTFRESNWEIAAVLRQLFKSEHFFDNNAIGVNIQGHVEFFTSFVNKMGLEYNQHYSFVTWYNDEGFDPEKPFHIVKPVSNNTSIGSIFYNNARKLGQILFNPLLYQDGQVDDHG